MLKLLFTTVLLGSYIDAASALAGALVGILFLERLAYVQQQHHWLLIAAQLVGGLLVALVLRLVGGVGVWNVRSLLVPRNNSGSDTSSLRDFGTERLFFAALLYVVSLPYERQLANGFPIGAYATPLVVLFVLMASDFLVSVEREEAQARMPGAIVRNFMQRPDFFGVRTGLVVGSFAYVDICIQQGTQMEHANAWRALLPLALYAGILLLSYVQSALLELDTSGARAALARATIPHKHEA